MYHFGVSEVLFSYCPLRLSHGFSLFLPPIKQSLRNQQQMNSRSSYNRQTIRFRRWSRRAYAAFASIGRCVTIGNVCKSIADSSLSKRKRNIPVDGREIRTAGSEGRTEADCPPYGVAADCCGTIRTIALPSCRLAATGEEAQAIPYYIYTLLYIYPYTFYIKEQYSEETQRCGLSEVRRSAPSYYIRTNPFKKI